MKNLIAVFLVLSAALPAAADESPRVVVPGTRVGLVSPEGFVPADRFPGFIQKETNASIMVNEIPGPFDRVSAGLTAAGLKVRDMILIRKEPITVGDLPGTLLQVSQNAYGVRYLKWISVFGDDHHTTMITASYPADLEARLAEPLRAAVATPEIVSDAPAPQEAAGFTFDLTPAGTLKAARRMGNKLLLTPEGAFPAPNPTDPSLVASAFTSQGLASQNKRDFANARVLSIATLKNVRIKQTNAVAIGGLDGIEILARGIDKKTGERMFVCQTMLFGKTDYYLMQGIARSADLETTLPVFRESMKSFKLKRP